MRKLLAGLILFVSILPIGRQTVLQAAVIDKNSPWGVV